MYQGTEKVYKIIRAKLDLMKMREINLNLKTLITHTNTATRHRGIRHSMNRKRKFIWKINLTRL